MIISFEVRSAAKHIEIKVSERLDARFSLKTNFNRPTIYKDLLFLRAIRTL